MLSHINQGALLYKDNRPLITFQEKRSRYVAINQSHKTVEAYQIDGVLIIDGARCDNGLAIPREKVFLLIELKGSDLCHACDQILSTLEFLKQKNVTALFNARIVLSKASGPDLKSVNYRKLSKIIRAGGGNLIQKNLVLEETI